jgi:hypothetical protein
MLLFVEVIGMLKRRNKIEPSLGSEKSENRIRRLLRSDKSFAVSLESSEGRDQESGFEGPWEDARNALLDTECKRAQALLRWQQNNQRFY